MSTRVTRSRSQQQSSDELQPQHSSDATTTKRTASGRKRKGKSNADNEKAESEPTLRLEAAGDGVKQAGQQLKLVAADDKESDQTQQPKEEQREKEDNRDTKSGKDENESLVAGEEGGWQDGHDSDTDYHEPQSPTQLVTLQQTDHRTAAAATPPSLPDDIDLSPVTINRAPVLTLWAAVLAHVGPAQLPWLSALTVGKAIAGMLAQSRGRSLGIFEPSADRTRKRQKTADEQQHEVADVQVLGIKVHMARVDQLALATISNKPVNASQCDRYVHQHLGGDRPRVMAVMRYVAQCLLARGVDGEADITGRYSFTLYEQFRPTLNNGQAPGWGQKGELDLRKMVEIGKNELESAKKEGTQLHLTTDADIQNGEEKENKKDEKDMK